MIISKDIDKWLIYFSFIEMLILKWILIGQDTIMIIISTIIIFRLITISKKFNFYYKKTIILLFPILGYIIISSLIRPNFKWNILQDNLGYIIQPLIWILYFGYLLTKRFDLLKECFENVRLILNIYYIVNFFIIIKQTEGTYFLMQVDKIENTFYKDQITGFLGIDGTGRLALFTIFILLLNIQYIFNSLRAGKVKHFTIFYIIIIFATAVYTSALNDNNAVYILLPFFVLLFYMFTPGTSRGKWFKIILLAFILLCILNFVANSTYINDILGSRINKVLDNILGIFEGSDNIEERMVYVMYVFANLHGFSFGTGFGTLLMRKDPMITSLEYEFRNWGMSDIAPFIAMGGLIFYICILVFYDGILFPEPHQKKERMYIFAILLVLSYYQQVLTITTMTIPMCWIIVLFALQRPTNQRVSR